MERYFLDIEDIEALLKDIDDNWNVDMDLALKKASIDHNCTNRQILKLLPLDKLIDYLMYKKIIPNVYGSDFLDNVFDKEWLDNNN